MEGMSNPNEDPWVCPNDRELSLRAKLNSGWSFYTFRILRTGLSKKFTIKKEEEEIIKNIIKKAEEVTEREEYRVGRLVDRLENIKNNAKGNGITTCLLCDEKFGKITTPPMKCNICEKAVCVKCGVDTISSGNVPIWLCKLCNEQREFWKKSGAWFLGRMPQHKLPSLRERAYLTSGSFVVSTPEMNRKSNLLSQVSEMYSDSDQESSLSSEEHHDEDHHHSSRQQGTRQSVDDITHHGSHPSFVKLQESLSSSRTPSPSRSDQLKDSRWSSDEVDSMDGTDSQHSRRSRILHHSPILVRKNGRRSVDSTLSEKSDSLKVAQSNGREPSPERSRLAAVDFVGSNENLEELFQTYGPDYKLAGPLGVIEFTVNYLKDDNRLDIHIQNAKGLRAMDSNGSSDPYVKTHLLPGASKGNKIRTQTLRKTLDPIFDETLTYHGITKEDMSAKKLRLQVLDEDRLGRNDFIGETTVPLKHVLIRNNFNMQRILEPKSEDELAEMTPDDSRGRIHVSLCYISKDHKLVVGIIRCANLIAMDSNGYSDPYVKCYLLPDPSKKTKRRTKMKKKNLNPEFNETFTYNIAHNELASKTLEITVWDYDVGTSNDFIGGIHLGIHSKDTLLKQWFETLKHQNKESKYWHSLTTDITLNEAE